MLRFAQHDSVRLGCVTHLGYTTLAVKLRERDRMLARAAEVANRSRQVRAIEQEFDRLGPEPEEPWDDTPAR